MVACHRPQAETGGWQEVHRHRRVVESTVQMLWFQRGRGWCTRKSLVCFLARDRHFCLSLSGTNLLCG